MSQEDLAHEVNLSSKTISQIERGVVKASFNTKKIIATYFKVAVADIWEFQQGLVEENVEESDTPESEPPTQQPENKPEPEEPKGKPGWPLSILFK